MPTKILLTGDFDTPEVSKDYSVVHIRNPEDVGEIESEIRDANHYIVGGPEYVDGKMLSISKELHQIIVMGTGSSSFVDLTAAERWGVEVENTPKTNSEVVAEYILGSLIFNNSCSVHSQNIMVKGGWYQKPYLSLKHKKIGIVGAGNIGGHLIKILKAVYPEIELCYYSRSRKQALEARYSIRHKSIERIFYDCDVVVVCMTYSEDYLFLMGRDYFRKGKCKSLYNFSNPLFIDPDDLRNCLQDGSLEFAFFDGYYHEWKDNGGLLDDEFGLFGLGEDKFVATTHIAAQESETIKNLLNESLQKVYDYQESRV